MEQYHFSETPQTRENKLQREQSDRDLFNRLYESAKNDPLMLDNLFRLIRGKFTSSNHAFSPLDAMSEEHRVFLGNLQDRVQSRMEELGK